MAQRYGFLIVEDVPYRLLRYQGNYLPTLWSFDDSCVLHVASFSKVLSPGMRVGYVVAPEAVMQKLSEIAFKNYGTPCLFSQGLVWEFCHRGWLEPEIDRLRDLYRPRLKAMLTALRRHLPQANWWAPEGGYYVGVTLPESCDTKAFRQRAERAAVILSHGEGFFVNGGERFLRLPFAGLQPEEIEEGIWRLAIASKEGSNG
jgi:DNA-binding transcriptional MocR family regulator